MDAVIYGTAIPVIDRRNGESLSADVSGTENGKSNERTDITGTWRVQTAPTPNNCTVLTTTVERHLRRHRQPPPGSVLISAVHFDA